MKMWLKKYIPRNYQRYFEKISEYGGFNLVTDNLRYLFGFLMILKLSIR